MTEENRPKTGIWSMSEPGKPETMSWEAWKEHYDDQVAEMFDDAMEASHEAETDIEALRWIEYAKFARDELTRRAYDRSTLAATKLAKANTTLALWNGVFAALAVIIAIVALFLR